MQKYTVAIHILAYGSPADSVDEYVRISESTVAECLEAFVKGVNDIFGDEHLRRPDNNINCLLQIRDARGFLGMLGFVDCIHWEWKNCPVAWQGKYHRGDHRKPTIILEAITSQDLWICCAYFGVLGLNNDIDVLNQSFVFNDVLQGRASPVQFTINEITHSIGCYLENGIYSD